MCGPFFGLALCPTLLRLDFLGFAGLLELLALLRGGFTNGHCLEDHHGAHRLLACSHIGAREGQRPHAGCTHHQPGFFQFPAFQTTQAWGQCLEGV